MIVFFIILCVLVILCYALSIHDMKENAEREIKENEEQKKRRYIKENRHIFGVSERGTMEMSSEQEVFVVSTKKMGIAERSGRKWD